MTESVPDDYPNTSYPPFSMRKITSYPIDGIALIEDRTNELQNHVDILGWHLFRARNDILETFSKLGEDAAFRAKLGTIKASKFETFANLDSRTQKIALGLAEEAMNHLIDRTAQTLGSGYRGYAGGLCIEYHIESRVLKIIDANDDGVKLKKIAKCVITDDRQGTLGGAFGRWLNMFNNLFR